MIDLDDWNDLVATADVPMIVPTDVRREFLGNYGTSYREVLATAGDDATLLGTFSGTDTLRAEVIHAMRHEMAMKLSDVVRRRTSIGTGGLADDSILDEISRLMAKELAWSEEQRRAEIEETREIYQPFGCATNAG